jgi:hypothetical protein
MRSLWPAVLVALVAGACGSDDAGSGGQPTTATRPEVPDGAPAVWAIDEARPPSPTHATFVVLVTPGRVQQRPHRRGPRTHRHRGGRGHRDHLLRRADPARRPRLPGQRRGGLHHHARTSARRTTPARRCLPRRLSAGRALRGRARPLARAGLRGPQEPSAIAIYLRSHSPVARSPRRPRPRRDGDIDGCDTGWVRSRARLLESVPRQLGADVDVRPLGLDTTRVDVHRHLPRWHATEVRRLLMAAPRQAGDVRVPLNRLSGSIRVSL